MADKDTLMEEFVATEAAKNEDAAKDLERVEQQVGRALPCRHETRAARHTALAARGDRGRTLREETQRSRPRAASPV